MQHARISIHAGNLDERYSPHPLWKDENDKELVACPFSASEDASRELHELNEIIESFLDRAPSDANAEVRIQRTADGFDATIDVYSSQRSFGPVQRIGTKFRDVVEGLMDEMKEEIEEWKQNRSLNVGDGL
ncbi:MAG: hypothetical protein V4760_08120 [Bdellovibrionota bacterium]